MPRSSGSAAPQPFMCVDDLLRHNGQQSRVFRRARSFADPHH